MFAGIIPFLLSLFSSGAGAAAAGTAAGAGAAGAAAGTAGAGAAGGTTAGGLGGLLGGLFGSGGGAGATGGSTSSAGGLGGLLSLFGQVGGGGPQQLSGPGMEGVTGAVGPGNGPQPAGAAGSGGFNLGSLLSMGSQAANASGGGVQPAGQNMMADLMGGIGRSYMQGALAGKGDFRGALGSLDQQAATANQTARTGIAQQESTRRQEEFDMQKAQQAKVDAANTKIAETFSKPGALDNITETFANILPDLLKSGDHAGASATINLLSKAATDKKTSVALSNATAIAGANRAPDGSYDFGKIQEGIAGLNDPNVSEVYDKVLHPRLIAESNVVNQKAIRQEAGVREERMQQRDIQREQDFQQNQGRMMSQFGENQARLTEALRMRQGLGPVPPAQLSHYIDKEGKNPQADPNLNQGNPTHGDLVQSGYARIDNPNVQATIRQSNIALSQLDRIKAVGDELFAGVKPGKTLLNAAKLKGQETVAAGEIRKFETLILETIPSMAIASGLPTRSLGENVLFKMEKPMMPNMDESQKTFNDKLDVLRQRLTINRNTFFGAGAKIPAEGGGAGGGQGGGTARPRAINPKTKEVKEFDGKDWVTVKPNG